MFQFFIDSSDCKDIECASVEEEVCGTDGITYTNECAIKTTACIFEEKSDLKVAFNGSCDSERDTNQVLSIPNLYCSKYIKQYT